MPWIIFFLVFFNTLVFSNEITLYDSPKQEAIKIGTLKSENGIVPIFFDNTNTWIKVGDSSNGNTGWVKKENLSFSNTIVGLTFSTETFEANIPSQKVNLKIGQSQTLTGDQTIAYLKKAQQQQIQLQTCLLNMLNFLYHDKPVEPIIIPILFGGQ